MTEERGVVNRDTPEGGVKGCGVTHCVRLSRSPCVHGRAVRRLHVAGDEVQCQLMCSSACMRVCAALCVCAALRVRRVRYSECKAVHAL